MIDASYRHCYWHEVSGLVGFILEKEVGGLPKVVNFSPAHRIRTIASLVKVTMVQPK